MLHCNLSIVVLLMASYSIVEIPAVSCVCAALSCFLLLCTELGMGWDWVGMDWVGMDWVGVGWGCVGMAMRCGVLSCVDLVFPALSWVSLS